MTEDARKLLGAAQKRLEDANRDWELLEANEPIEPLEAEVSDAGELKMTIQRDLSETRTDLAEALASRTSASQGDAEAGDTQRLDRQVASLRARLQSIQASNGEVAASVAEKAALLEKRKGHRETVEQERRAARAQFEAASSKMNDALASAAVHGEQLEIVDPSIIPQRPSSPNVPLNISAALVFALITSSAYVAASFGYSRMRLRQAETDLSLSLTMIAADHWRWESRHWIPIALGGWAAAIALAPSYTIAVALALPLLAIPLLWWTLLEPQRWVVLFFGACILLPPLPVELGGSGPHVAVGFALTGILAGVVRSTEWKTPSGTLPHAFAWFLIAVAASVSCALVYSGAVLALGSVSRLLLFGIGPYIFLYTYSGPGNVPGNPLRTARLLFGIGMLAALFACVDFYFQFPAPAGYGPQFVWLETGVFRRAQGMFYEASTLGNFCAFFLTMAMVSLFQPARDRPCSRLELLAGSGVFMAALIFSYSRASIVNIAASTCAFLFIRRPKVRRSLFLMGACAIAGAAASYFVLPDLAIHSWQRLFGSFGYFWSAPDEVLSGRLASWQMLADFVTQNPWYAVFGIGYKTLPYTDLLGGGVVADNTYLSLFVETGLAGLAAFLFLNGAILRTSLRAARSSQPRAAFFGAWIFSFWTGEMVQMLSGDLITYWRVLPLYFWVLAIAARESL